jgi:hypothetical protein
MKIRVAVSTVGQSLTVEVSSESTRESLPCKQALVQLFEDPSFECEMRTTITVSSADGQTTRPIELYWTPELYVAESVGILAVEATQVLFIGAGRFLAVVNYSTGEVLGEHEITLFWNLTHIRNCVLLRSELECYLFSENGRLTGSTRVDPP